MDKCHATMSANIGKGADLLLSIKYDDRLITDGGCYILAYFGNFTLVATQTHPSAKTMFFSSSKSR